MLYRTLGRTSLKVSEIGLGFEHLLDKEQSVVTDTVRAAVEGGINYFDCLSHDKLFFQKLGIALSGLRDKVILTFIANSELSPEEMEGEFSYFLDQVGTDYVDIFIIACCDKTSSFERVTGSGGLLAYAEKLKVERIIGAVGLSTHVSDIAMKAVESASFDVLMVPVNPAFDVITDEEKHVSDNIGHLWDAAYLHKPNKTEELRRKNVFIECQKRNVGLVAMKPFAAGWLFDPNISAGFTPVNLISYALTQTGISTVVPGCASKEELDGVLAYYSCSEEERDFSHAIKNSRWSVKGNCQYCSHCLPCAADIDIAWVNRSVDIGESSDYDNLSVKASSCIKCGICEDRCPFDVKVMEKMDRAVQMFES